MPRKIQRWKTSIWKDAPHHIPLGNCKLKKQADTTTCLSEWPAFKGPIIPNAGKDVNQQELSFFGGGDAKW